MNKKEKEIILNGYRRNLVGLTNGYKEEEAVREYKLLLNQLGLKKERYEMENKILADYNELKSTEIEMYDMIIRDLNKYGVYCNYSEIENYIYELEYEFTEEEVKCNKVRVRYLSEHKKLELKTIF